MKRRTSEKEKWYIDEENKETNGKMKKKKELEEEIIRKPRIATSRTGEEHQKN